MLMNDAIARERLAASMRAAARNADAELKRFGKVAAEVLIKHQPRIERDISAFGVAVQAVARRHEKLLRRLAK